MGNCEVNDERIATSQKQIEQIQSILFDKDGIHDTIKKIEVKFAKIEGRLTLGDEKMKSLDRKAWFIIGIIGAFFTAQVFAILKIIPPILDLLIKVADKIGG